MFTCVSIDITFSRLSHCHRDIFVAGRPLRLNSSPFNHMTPQKDTVVTLQGVVTRLFYLLNDTTISYGLFNAKIWLISKCFIITKTTFSMLHCNQIFLSLGWLVGFHGIATFRGYLTPNLFFMWIISPISNNSV